MSKCHGFSLSKNIDAKNRYLLDMNDLEHNFYKEKSHILQNEMKNAPYNDLSPWNKLYFIRIYKRIGPSTIFQSNNNFKLKDDYQVILTAIPVRNGTLTK